MMYVKDGILNPCKKIRTEDGLIYNPTPEQIAAAGYVEFVPPAPTLDDVKAGKVSEIEAYDGSDAVNQFFIGSAPVWIAKADRVGLMLRFESEEAVGKTTTTLWYEGVCFTLPIASAKAMLAAIEVYASACYDCTEGHKAAVNALTSEADVEAYDITAGYPAKLTFAYE